LHGSPLCKSAKAALGNSLTRQRAFARPFAQPRCVRPRLWSGPPFEQRRIEKPSRAESPPNAPASPVRDARLRCGFLVLEHY